MPHSTEKLAGAEVECIPLSFSGIAVVGVPPELARSDAVVSERES